MTAHRLVLRIVLAIAILMAAPLIAVTKATAAVPQVTAQSAVTKLMDYYDVGTDLIEDSSTGWWQGAVDQSALESYEQAADNTTYYDNLAATYSHYASGNSPAGLPDFEDNFFDDTGWWGLAWLQAYVMTGETSYLTVAEDDAAYIYDKGWDTDSSSCGGSGGVYWELSSGTPEGRLAIPNELFLELTAWLYNVTGNSAYLNWANSEWSWFSGTGIIDSSYQVYDGYNGACSFSGADIWSYNQGVILAGLAQLYIATGNSALLTEAENIANAEISNETSGGALQEWCGACTGNGNAPAFKGIFVRDLAMLAATADTTQFNSFFQDQASDIEANDTDASNQVGMLWDTALSSSCPSSAASDTVDEADNLCNSATQGSGVDALTATLELPAGRPAGSSLMRRNSRDQQQSTGSVTDARS